MISKSEINQKAREHGVPVSTIERDYVQNWLLMSLSSLPMVLKGGTGIRKVYIADYRFSDDLDFTLLEEIDEVKLENLIKKSVRKAKDESGIKFSEDIRIQENVNGFEGDVYFQISQIGKSRTRIKLDMTKLDNEVICLPLTVRRIIHPYSDKLDAGIEVYSLEEITAEKIRSLFQRTRPRDLYDVWVLLDKVDTKEVFRILPVKFKVKNVEVDIDGIKQRKEDFKNAWDNSLRHQLRQLPEFDVVFSSVLKGVKKCASKQLNLTKRQY